MTCLANQGHTYQAINTKKFKVLTNSAELLALGKITYNNVSK